MCIHTHTHTHTHVFREHFFVVARRKNEGHTVGKETCREMHRETDKKHGRIYPTENFFYARHQKKGVETTMELGGVRSVFEKRINAICFTL